jgi:hypothetical protein
MMTPPHETYTDCPSMISFGAEIYTTLTMHAHAQTFYLEYSRMMDETPAPGLLFSWRGCLAPYRSSLKVRKEAFSHGLPYWQGTGSPEWRMLAKCFVMPHVVDDAFGAGFCWSWRPLLQPSWGGASPAPLLLPPHPVLSCNLTSNFSACPRINEKMQLSSTGRGTHQKCRHIFLDVGANVGLNAHFLYNGTAFPKSLKMVPLMDKMFGRDRSHVCYRGFEPNMNHIDRHVSLRQNFKDKDMVIYNSPVGISDSSITF